MSIQRQSGDVRLPANADLTHAEGHLVEIVNASTVAKVDVPNANTDLPLFVVKNGAASGAMVDLIPLRPGEAVTVKMKGTGNPGTKLILADVSTAEDKGKLRADNGSGARHILAIAEEAFVDGQLARVRPITLHYAA